MSSKKPFEEEWGDVIASGGFTQVPNDLLRNIAALGLSCNEAMVLHVIMSYGRGKKVAAATVASHLGLSIGTVRASLRKLDKLKYLHRHFQTGDASLYSWGGLRPAVEPYAKNRQTRTQNLALGVYDSLPGPGGNLNTNKEKLNNEDKKEGSGYAKFKAAKEDLIRKKSV